MEKPTFPLPRRLACALAVAFLGAFPLQAAGVSVPELSLLTHGCMDGDLFALKSRIALSLAFEGGSKFLGSVKLGLQSGDIEGDSGILGIGLPSTGSPSNEELGAALRAESRLSLVFGAASITIRGDPAFPLETTWFIGKLDSLCSGVEFPALFGTPRVASDLRGFMYSPNGVGGNENVSYDGIHAVEGTGFKLALRNEHLYGALYGYQDLLLGSGHYSADARLILNYPAVKADVFMGASGPESAYGLYRAGALLYLKAGDAGAFLFEAGVPRFDPALASTFGIDQFFFLFEPRLKVGVFSFIPTLFYHPAWYLMEPTGEDGTLDLNLNMKVGDLESGGRLQGGAETMLSFNPEAASSPLEITFSPYASASLGGAIWDAKVSVGLFPWGSESILSHFEAYIGARTGF